MVPYRKEIPFLQSSGRNYSMQYSRQCPVHSECPVHSQNRCSAGCCPQHGAPARAYGWPDNMYGRPVLPHCQLPVYARYDSSVRQCCHFLLCYSATYLLVAFILTSLLGLSDAC